MLVFVSYAAEDREIAERVHLALTGAGHHTFFDRTNLPPGREYNERIRGAVEQCDAMVFLASANSTASGSYALTELKYARAKWRHPDGHVIPVRLREISLDAIPNYLKAVTVMEPEGDLAAEVVLAISNLQRHLGAASEPGQDEAINRATGSRTSVDQKSQVAAPVVAALIGLVGTLGAVVIANRAWETGAPPALANEAVLAQPTQPMSRSGVGPELNQWQRLEREVQFYEGRMSELGPAGMLEELRKLADYLNRLDYQVTREMKPNDKQTEGFLGDISDLGMHVDGLVRFLETYPNGRRYLGAPPSSIAFVEGCDGRLGAEVGFAEFGGNARSEEEIESEPLSWGAKQALGIIEVLCKGMTPYQKLDESAREAMRQEDAARVLFRDPEPEQ